MAPPFGTSDRPGARDEEFLYHLYRGSDLLQDGRINDAKVALERALEYQPKDVKGQDLLAVVYFRLGVYPRAIEIYRQLVSEHPREPVLRVNLAVVYLKTGQPEEALLELKAALDVQPDHRRALSYLGLVHQQLGDHARARDAYLRAGLVHMARKVDERRSAEAGGRTPEDVARDSHRREDVGQVADRAFEEIDAEDNPFLIEPERATPAAAAPWHALEPGGLPPPKRPPAADPEPIVLPVPFTPSPQPQSGTVTDFPSLEGSGLVVEPGGALVVQAVTGVYTRVHPLFLFEGALEFERAKRRSKGRERDEGFGDDPHGMHRVRGVGRVVLAPVEGERYSVLKLDDQAAYLREEVVVAFTDPLHWENGQVPIPDGNIRLVSFRGTGSVALSVASPIRRLTVRAAEGVSVEPSRIVGWVGRLLPRVAPRPGATEPSLLHLAGEGYLLVGLG